MPKDFILYALFWRAFLLLTFLINQEIYRAVYRAVYRAIYPVFYPVFYPALPLNLHLLRVCN